MTLAWASCAAQRVPSKWRIVPAGPTAQTSLGVRPNTANSGLPCATGLSQHQPCGVHMRGAQTPGTAAPPQAMPAPQVPQVRVALQPSEKLPQLAPRSPQVAGVQLLVGGLLEQAATRRSSPQRLM